MIVTFTQKTSDFFNAQKYVIKKLKSRTKIGFLGTLTGFIFGLFIAFGLVLIREHYAKYGSIGNGELNKGLIFIAIAVAVQIIGAYIYNKKIRSLLFEKNGPYLSQQEFKIERDHLAHKMGLNEHFYQWEYVKEIEKTDSFIYIFIDSGVAIYIPIYAFKNENESNSFYEALLKSKKANRVARGI